MAISLAFDVYLWIIIPFLIFLSRVIDVSIGTIRVIFISKGYRIWAPLLGFFEVIVWLVAINQLLGNLNNAVGYIAYAAGFAMGTYTGILIEEKISFGKVVLRIVTGHDSKRLLQTLKREGLVVTSNGAMGPDGKVKVIFTVIDRKDVRHVVDLVKLYNPNAFYSIEDVRFASGNASRAKKKHAFGFYRKEK